MGSTLVALASFEHSGCGRTLVSAAVARLVLSIRWQGWPCRDTMVLDIDIWVHITKFDTWKWPSSSFHGRRSTTLYVNERKETFYCRNQSVLISNLMDWSDQMRHRLPIKARWLPICKLIVQNIILRLQLANVVGQCFQRPQLEDICFFVWHKLDMI